MYFKKNQVEGEALLKQFLIKTIFKKYNFDKSNIYMLRSNHKDTKDKEFLEIFNSKAFRDNSLLDYSRAYFLYQSLINLKGISGDVAECGSFRGGTAYMFGKITNEQISIFDTFEGMPDLITEHDTHRAGDLKNTSIEHVTNLLKEFDNINIYQGFFSDTFKQLSEKKYKFVHCDADIYQSIMDVNNYFYNRMEKGGIIVYDDYGWASTKGAQKAILEFFEDKPELPIYLPTRQAFIIKQ